MKSSKRVGLTKPTRRVLTLRLILKTVGIESNRGFYPMTRRLFLGGKTTVEDSRECLAEVCRPKGSFNSRLKWRGGISQSGCLCWNGTHGKTIWIHERRTSPEAASKAGTGVDRAYSPSNASDLK